MKNKKIATYLYRPNKLNGVFIKVILLSIGITLLLLTQLSAEYWEQLYPEIDAPVADMEFSEILGISEYGLIFAIADSGGGLGYFDSTGNFSIFSVATNLGAVSVAADNANNRIFCAFGCGSYSDGLYEFDVATHQFELIEWIYNPNFVKKLSSGFYFGYDNGMMFSETGDEWEQVDYFIGKRVKDIEELSDGTIFVSFYYNLFIPTCNGICVVSDSTFNSYSTGLPVHDIYIYQHQIEEVFISTGGGTFSDGIYKVEYENGEIIGFTVLNWCWIPGEIYCYDDWLVVASMDLVYPPYLFLVEPVEMGEMHQIGIGLDFETVYCFETYPIYCHNIMVGTDNGIFLGINLNRFPNCELSTFTVQYLDNVATLYWVTQSETDNLGWNIYRSINDSSFANAEMINIDLIPGYGTTTEPHSYIYEDLDLEPNSGDIIWYWLESITLGGVSYVYYPPVSLVIPSGIDDWHLHSKDIVLSQNYPNPFDAFTTISFNLATNKHEFIPLNSKHITGQAQIKIYNIKGELIKQLSILNSKSSIKWDGKDENDKKLSNGIYFYCLESGNYKSKTKKMILLR